jgi:hypothetical protein
MHGIQVVFGFDVSVTSPAGVDEVVEGTWGGSEKKVEIERRMEEKRKEK